MVTFTAKESQGMFLSPFVFARAIAPEALKICSMMGCGILHGSMQLRSHGDLFGNGPHKAYQFTGNSHDHLVGMFASG